LDPDFNFHLDFSNSANYLILLKSRLLLLSCSFIKRRKKYRKIKKENGRIGKGRELKNIKE